jgi:hypothetical protein
MEQHPHQTRVAEQRVTPPHCPIQQPRHQHRAQRTECCSAKYATHDAEDSCLDSCAGQQAGEQPKQHTKYEPKRGVSPRLGAWDATGVGRQPREQRWMGRWCA